MIPRLDLDGPKSLWPTQWPAQRHRSFRTPFEARAPLRKIRVVIDIDTTSHEATDQWSAARLLAGILRHPYLQVTRFSDTGPPPDVPRLPPPNDQMAKGWVTLADGPAGERGGFDYSVGEHAGCTGYEPDTAAWVAREPNTSYGHLDPTAAQQRRDRDGVAMAVAISLQPDLFITNREHLLLRRDQTNHLSVCTTVESVALLGLYLRAQGDYRYWFDPEGRLTPTCDRRTFYWVGTRELLPAAWRWIKGCSQLARSSTNDSLSLLALSALERMVQVLKYRDAMHRHFNQPVRDVRGDDAIEAFEAALAMMMAAVDITARVAHKVLDIKTPIRRAGWQNSDWLPKAAESVPGIDKIVAPQSPNSDALIILRHLRNTLHSEAMRGAGIHRPGRAPTALMALPSEHQTDVLTAMERLGGREMWSIQNYTGTQLRADPGTLLEMLLPLIVRFLNDAMQATSFASWPNVTLTAADCLPPGSADRIIDDFSGPQRASIRLLLGL